MTKQLRLPTIFGQAYGRIWQKERSHYIEAWP